MTQLPNIAHILPELFIAVMAMALLLYGAFAGESSARTVSWA